MVSGESSCVQSVYTFAYCLRSQCESSEIKKKLFKTLPKTSPYTHLNSKISGGFQVVPRWYQVIPGVYKVCTHLLIAKGANLNHLK